MKYTKIFFIVLVSFLIFNTKVNAQSLQIADFPFSTSTKGTNQITENYSMSFSFNGITDSHYKSSCSYMNNLYCLELLSGRNIVSSDINTKNFTLTFKSNITNVSLNNIVDFATFNGLDLKVQTIGRGSPKFRYQVRTISTNTLLYESPSDISVNVSSPQTLTFTLNNGIFTFFRNSVSLYSYNIDSTFSLSTFKLEQQFIKDLTMTADISLIDYYSQSEIDLYSERFNDFFENNFVNSPDYDSYYIRPFFPYENDERYVIVVYQFNKNDFSLDYQYWETNENDLLSVWFNQKTPSSIYDIEIYQLDNINDLTWSLISDGFGNNNIQVEPQVMVSNDNINWLKGDNVFHNFDYIQAFYKSTIPLIFNNSFNFINHIDILPLDYKGLTVNLGYHLFEPTDTSCQIPNKINPISLFSKYTTPLNSIGIIINDLRYTQKDFNVFLEINTESSFISRIPISYYYDYENNTKLSSFGYLGVGTYEQVNDCITTYYSYLPYVVKNDKANNYFYYIEYDKVIAMLPDTVLHFYIDNNLVLNVDYEIIWVYENTTINFTNPNTNLPDTIVGGTSITPSIENELSFVDFLKLQMFNMRTYFNQMTSLSRFMNYFIASMPPIFSVMLAISFVFIVIKFIRGVFF